MKGSYLFLLAIVVIACNDSDPLPVVGSGVKIKAVIYRVNGGSFVTLSCQTVDWYPCANYFLDSKRTFDGEKLSITFTEAISPDICLTSSGPARVSFELDSIPNGEYRIELNNGHLRNGGVLKITANDVTLDLNSQDGIAIENQTVKLAPEGTFVGYISHRSLDVQDKVNEFLDKVQDMDGVTAFNNQVPGVYSAYTIGEDGKLLLLGNCGCVSESGVIFQYKGDDEEQFIADLDALATSYNDSMSISIYTRTKDDIDISVNSWD